MKAVLDANVLFPTILREILTDLAGQGLYQPLWSARILAEWRYAVTRLGPEQEQIAGAEIALLQSKFPEASMPDDGNRAIDLDLPDPADRHVIEAALAGRASLIVTANLRDFPRRMMETLELRAIHPDAFLLDLLAAYPLAVTSTVQSVRDKAARMGGDMTVPEMLRRSRLPRLSRALTD